jgi:hypothetical protein
MMMEDSTAWKNSRRMMHSRESTPPCRHPNPPRRPPAAGDGTPLVILSDPPRSRSHGIIFAIHTSFPHNPIPKPSFIIAQRRGRIRLHSFPITVTDARTTLLPIPHGALWRPGTGQTLMVHTSARLAVPAQRCLVGAWGEFRCKMRNNFLETVK